MPLFLLLLLAGAGAVFVAANQTSSETTQGGQAVSDKTNILYEFQDGLPSPIDYGNKKWKDAGDSWGVREFNQVTPAIWDFSAIAPYSTRYSAADHAFQSLLQQIAGTPSAPASAPASSPSNPTTVRVNPGPSKTPVVSQPATQPKPPPNSTAPQTSTSPAPVYSVPTINVQNLGYIPGVNGPLF